MTRQDSTSTTRRTILDTGRRLVSRGGFGAVGLSTLLRESGVPKGSFYHYFPSKEAFGEAMLQDYVADYLARMDALLSRDGSAAEKVEIFTTAWLDQEREAGLVSTCLVVKLGAEVADLSEAMRQVLDDGVVALTGRIARLLREGADDGSLHAVPDPDGTAQALYARLLGAAILSKLATGQAPLERAVADIKAQLIPDAQEGRPL